MLRLLLLMPLIARLLMLNDSGDGGLGDGSDGDGSGSGDGPDGAGEGDGSDDDAAALAEVAALAKELGITPAQVKGRLQASRKWEERAKANKTAADELEALKRSQMSDQEKAVDEARIAARAEALRDVGAKLVDAEIRAASAGRMSDEQRTVLLDGLDRSRFLTDDGDVDTAKVASFIDGIAPAKGDDGKRFPDLGQGRRPGKVKPSVAAGRDMYEASKTKAPA